MAMLSNSLKSQMDLCSQCPVVLVCESDIHFFSLLLLQKGKLESDSCLLIGIDTKKKGH